MAKNDNLKDFLTDVADAIREKKGSTDLINPQDFSSEIANIQSGGRDWSEIGYDAEPLFIEEGFAYAKEIKDNWDDSATSMRSKYSRDKQLLVFPDVDTSKVGDMMSAFEYSTLMFIPVNFSFESVSNMAYAFRQTPLHGNLSLRLPKVTTMNSVFYYCICINEVEITYAPLLTTLRNGFHYSGVTKLTICDLPSCTNLDYLVQSTNSVTEVSLGDCPVCTSIANAFQYNDSALRKVVIGDLPRCSNYNSAFDRNYNLGYVSKLNYASATSATNTFTNCKALRHLDVVDLGQSSLATYDFSGATNWGVATTDIPDARQSLIDSLITYSYDRASNGMATATITLSANTKALLTEEEIAQITAKGFTIA